MASLSWSVRVPDGGFPLWSRRVATLVARPLGSSRGGPARPVSLRGVCCRLAPRSRHSLPSVPPGRLLYLAGGPYLHAVAASAAQNGWGSPGCPVGLVDVTTLAGPGPLAPPLSLVPRLQASWLGFNGLAGVQPHWMMRPLRPYDPAAMGCARAGLIVRGSGPAAALRQGGIGASLVWLHLLRPVVPLWVGTSA